jgi:hypothetical protein
MTEAVRCKCFDGEGSVLRSSIEQKVILFLPLTEINSRGGLLFHLTAVILPSDSH